MDLEKIKAKLSEDEFAELSEHVKGLGDRIEAAAAADTTKRKKFKEVADDRDRLRKRVDALHEYNGIDEETDLSTLPAAKKASAEEAQQWERRRKALEADLATEREARGAAETKHRDMVKRVAVAEAIGKFDFVDKEVVESFIGTRLVWEGDELFYKDGDRTMSVADAVAGVAKTRPHLLKPTGAGGAGVRQGNAGGGAGKSMPQAEFNALPPKDRAAKMAEGYVLTD